jgi:hypothetical protein
MTVGTVLLCSVRLSSVMDRHGICDSGSQIHDPSSPSLPSPIFAFLYISLICRGCCLNYDSILILILMMCVVCPFLG